MNYSTLYVSSTWQRLVASAVVLPVLYSRGMQCTELPTIILGNTKNILITRFLCILFSVGAGLSQKMSPRRAVSYGCLTDPLNAAHILQTTSKHPTHQQF